MQLHNGNNIDEDAYEMGWFAAADSIKCNSKPNNPFKENTDAWYSWNNGWNSYMMTIN